MPGAPSSFLFLLVRHLLLEAMHLFLVASLLLVAMPGAPTSFLFLVVRPGAPSSVRSLLRLVLGCGVLSFDLV